MGIPEIPSPEENGLESYFALPLSFLLVETMLCEPFGMSSIIAQSVKLHSTHTEPTLNFAWSIMSRRDGNAVREHCSRLLAPDRKTIVTASKSPLPSVFLFQMGSCPSNQCFIEKKPTEERGVFRITKGQSVACRSLSRSCHMLCGCGGGRPAE